ncbi:MAG TPA: dihydropyrimidinase [Anaerolineales bacterium]|nr:dihydropyrimidinase [Anaerolineales bacterium]
MQNTETAPIEDNPQEWTRPRKLLIRGGTVVTPVDTFWADILILGETIVQVGRDIREPDAEVVDASGTYILPGGVDPHTHFALPMFQTVSSDDHYSGTKAAAFGGTTTVLDFIPQEYPTLMKGFEIWSRKAREQAAVDYSFHINITNASYDMLREVPKLLKQGITTLKVFMAYNGRLRLQDGEIFRVLRLAEDLKMLTMLHAENGDVIDYLVDDVLMAGLKAPQWHAVTRPAWGAAESLLRGAALAAQAASSIYIVHMNSALEVDLLKYARDKGIRVMGETCPQYLLFTAEALQRPDGAKWICSPPLRTSADNDALWRGLRNGTIQTIGTDHCPFFYDGTRPILYEGREVMIPGKELGAEDFTQIPNGVPMVGDRLPVLWTAGVGAGRISMNQFVEFTSANPARIFGLYPKKGAILPGSDADLVLWDPKKKLTYGVKHSHHRTDYNLFEGWELKGMPAKVFLRGNLIVDGNRWLGKAGMGKFLYRKPGAEFI